MVPFAEEAYLSCPARESPQRDQLGTVFGRSAGLTTSSSGVEATELMKAKSLTLFDGELGGEGWR